MIQDNCLRIRREIDRISAENGIGQKVTLVAVTKKQPVECIAELAAAGISDFAENRVVALEERASAMPGTRHLIGHLQTNKVKKAIAVADLIHSVDSLRLAKEISRCAEAAGKTVDILIQVNIAKEPQKFGVFSEDLDDLLREISLLPHLRIRGLMAIMPIETKDEYYGKMYDLYCNYAENKPYNISMDILSMGMSNDYATAVRYGSNMVRVGTALFA